MDREHEHETTPGGRVLGDADFERLADEAETETVEDGAGRIVERIDTTASGMGPPVRLDDLPIAQGAPRTREEAEEHRRSLLRRALADPGAFVPRIFERGPDWDPESTDAELLYLWQARAVEHVFPELAVDPPPKVPRRRAEMESHMTTVTYSRRVRDFFRERFWVRCWNCDLKLGPFTSPERALEEAEAAEADEAGVIPSCA